MDCLILGGYGYLGSRIVDHLKDKLNIVIGTENKTDFKSNYRNIYGYRKSNEEQLDVITKKFDLIIDASGISGQSINLNSTKKILNLNSFWPKKLAKSCIKNNCNLTFFSSSHCENFSVNDDTKLKEIIYPYSKILAEKMIQDIAGWDKRISIIRLGNLIGSPGKIYKGNSKLLPLDISKGLVNKGFAKINSDPFKKIGFVPIAELLSSSLLNSPGFHRLYSKEKISIYDITHKINSCYEKTTGLKGIIKVKNKIKKECNDFISEEIILEIMQMIDFFLGRKKVE